MVKFLNKKCGVIENVEREDLIKMYRNHTDVYEEIKEKKATKDELTLKDLKALADEKGIEYTTKTTKAELLELLNADNE